ncbi:MAG: ATP-binding cassette domain-containing protein [Yoonia sp.]|jgi:thiamine transport system ATP-binding protein|nr:ATP-binding cassette domain-containing protein [Yoonia sp.]MDG1768007.1 ATP-binding cassette domain-containing protein [Yoonia sp.]MDG1866294.1 ATP-binding cassette domain-containing protein [Yoonia sp.]
MLTCKDLRISQGDFVLAADVAFPKAGVTAIIGASGAGKSTLLLAIAGFVAVASGDVAHGDPFTDAAPGKRPVSMLFQDNNLFPHLSIGDNVALGLPKSGDASVVADVLACVGLSGMEERKPAALSGGQQSRAALARLLLAERQIVLLDEPFAALGPGLKDEMLDLMRTVLVEQMGATVLMITHDPDDARRVADHVAWVADGRVNVPRPTAEIFADPPAGLRAYMGQMG